MPANHKSSSQSATDSPAPSVPSTARDGDPNGRLAIVLALAILMFTGALTLFIVAAASNA